MELLLDYHQGEGVFTLNNNEIKMGLKDMTLISILKVVNVAQYRTWSRSRLPRIVFF